MWREAEPGGARVDQEFIPAGYDIAICIYALHHNESYFEEPFRFSPDRWLSAGASPGLKAVNDAYSPFSCGPRACIGQSLALLEISIALARVIWSMDFRIDGNGTENPGTSTSNDTNGRNTGPEYRLYSHLTSYSHGPMLAFRKRG